MHLPTLWAGPPRAASHLLLPRLPQHGVRLDADTLHCIDHHKGAVAAVRMGVGWGGGAGVSQRCTPCTAPTTIRAPSLWEAAVPKNSMWQGEQGEQQG